MQSVSFMILGLLIARSSAEEIDSSRKALEPFASLIGKWKAAGVPEGTREEKQKGHWSETLEWVWRFSDGKAMLEVTFTEGKYFRSGKLIPIDQQYRFELTTIDKQTWIFTGKLEKQQLNLERTDSETKETQKFILSLLHDNRMTYRFDVKPQGKTFFSRKYLVGATKEGTEFVQKGFSEKECIVSGGQGSSTVSYQGKTYYVCCSGCRDEFNANPEKYVKEFEAKRAKAQGKK